jgi:hypothetical protein
MDVDVDVDVDLHSTDIRNRRGDRALRAIYGNTYDSLSKNLSTYHPCIWNIVRQSVYGYQLSRQILSLPEIECVSVTSLTAMNVPRQLQSHIRGAKHNHVPYEILLSIFHDLRTMYTAQQIDDAVQLLNKVYGVTTSTHHHHHHHDHKDRHKGQRAQDHVHWHDDGLVHEQEEPAGNQLKGFMVVQENNGKLLDKRCRIESSSSFNQSDLPLAPLSKKNKDTRTAPSFPTPTTKGTASELSASHAHGGTGTGTDRQNIPAIAALATIESLRTRHVSNERKHEHESAQVERNINYNHNNNNNHNNDDKKRQNRNSCINITQCSTKHNHTNATLHRHLTESNSTITQPPRSRL